MGNEWSKTQVEEHQDGDLSENDSEVGVEIQNGPITQQTRPGVNAIKGTEQVDLKQPVQQDNIITSSQKTIVFSPISNGNTSSQPPAQSKLSMTISRPSTGRTTFQPNGPGVGVEKPQVTLGDPLIIQASNVNPVVVQTNSIGIQSQAPSSTGGASVSISEPKPKEISIFERLFKPEKKVQIEVPVQNEETGITVNNNMGLQSAPPNYDQPIQITDDSKQDSVLVLSSDSPGLSTGEDITDTQTASQSPPSTPQEEVHPIMSFFKTLVSSNKPVPKSEEEVKNEPEEKKKDNGGLRKSPTKKEKSKSFSEQILDAEAKGSKKSDSPKSRTLSRLFRQKSQKEEPASGKKVSEEQAVVSVSVNAEKAVPEPILILDPIPSESNVQSQITAQTQKDDGKAAKESAPRLRPFWRKSFKLDLQPTEVQENSLKEDLQTSPNTGNAVQDQVPVSVSVNTPQILTEDANLNAQSQITVQASVDEGKTVKESSSRPVPFWRKSFKADPPPINIQGNDVQEPAVVSVSLNSEKSAPPQISIPVANPNTQSQLTVQISPDEGNSVKEATLQPVPFWRKSFKAEPPSVKIQANGVQEPAVVSFPVNVEKNAPELIVIQQTKPNAQPQIIMQSSLEEKNSMKESTSRPVPFWRKSFKGDPPPMKVQQNDVDEPGVLSVSVNSEKSAPEPVLILDTNPNTQSQNTGQSPPDGGKAVKESPRPVPFWRKSFKADVPPVKIQENDVQEPAVLSISVNSEKSAPEPVLIQDINPNTPSPSPGQGTQDEGLAVKESTQRPVPFWRKSFKADPPALKIQNGVQEPAVLSVSVNSEKSTPESILIQESNPNAQSLNVEQTPTDQGISVQESTRPVPFWKKSFKVDSQVQPTKIQENSVKEDPQVIQLTLNASAEPEVQVGKANIDVAASSSGTKAPETQDKSKKPENGKNAKPKIMTFFKQLSVIGDAGNPNSEEGKQESTSPPTLDITDGVEVTKNEKTVVTAVIETPPQKNKETAKEKKGSTEKISKQDSRESPEAAGSVQLQLSEPGLVVNGADTAKDGQLKRTEKRQSLGSFFKAIGPKRMCDAEVQTDPVSILPAEKVK
ncbi:breast carcinoma-amplified sequence 1 [Pelobates fuscus]|uniref:breast carcinoma-amplified sequence 1 n=1 Tax=Pelobates fuscus TaxID=191477 RepID=UPI002FE46AEC